jgi:hypothetical protein
MATRKRYTPQRADWQLVESFQLTDGSEASKWMNIVTGEEATLRAGKHPFDNLNAATPPQTLPVTVAPTESTEEQDSEPEPEETPADRVAAMLARAHGKERATLKIKKFQTDGSLAWCADYTPEQFEETSYDGIRRDFGPGKYELTLYAKNPATKKYARYGYEIVTILPAPKDESQRAGDDSRLIGLLEKLTERIERIESKPAPDPMQNMASVLALAKEMREAFGLNVPQPQHQSPISTLKEVAAFMQIAKQLREEIEPAPKDESLAGVGLEALKVIGQMVGSKVNESAAMPTIEPPPALLENPQPQPLLQQSQPQPQPQPTESPEMIAFKQAISILNGMAIFNVDPEFAAEQIYEKAPDEILALLFERADWFEQVRALAPEVTPYESFYRAVHAKLREIYDEEMKQGAGNKTGTDNV